MPKVMTEHCTKRNQNQMTVTIDCCYLYYYKDEGCVCVCVFVCHVYAGHLPIDGSASIFYTIIGS